MSDLPGTVVQVVGVGRPTPVSTTARRLNHNQRLFNQRSPPHLLQHGPPPRCNRRRRRPHLIKVIRLPNKLLSLGRVDDGWSRGAAVNAINQKATG